MSKRVKLKDLKPGSIFTCDRHPEEGLYLILENKTIGDYFASRVLIITIDLDSDYLEKEWYSEFDGFSVLVTPTKKC